MTLAHPTKPERLVCIVLEPAPMKNHWKELNNSLTLNTEFT